jgi:hypothetical protein
MWVAYLVSAWWLLTFSVRFYHGNQMHSSHAVTPHSLIDHSALAYKAWRQFQNSSNAVPQEASLSLLELA